MARESVFPPPSEDSIATQLRQLALVDRVLGLEAEVARLSSAAPSADNPRLEIERLSTELAAVYASRTWRLGTAALRPVRAAARVFRPAAKR